MLYVHAAPLICAAIIHATPCVSEAHHAPLVHATSLIHAAIVHAAPHVSGSLHAPLFALPLSSTPPLSVLPHTSLGLGTTTHAELATEWVVTHCS